LPHIFLLVANEIRLSFSPYVLYMPYHTYPFLPAALGPLINGTYCVMYSASLSMYSTVQYYANGKFVCSSFPLLQPQKTFTPYNFFFFCCLLLLAAASYSYCSYSSSSSSSSPSSSPPSPSIFLRRRRT